MLYMNARTIVGVLLAGALVALLSLGSTSSYSLFNGGTALLSDFREESVTASAVLVSNMETGEVLFARAEDEVFSIASVSKLFTAHVAHQSEAIDDPVLIVWQDFVTEGTAGALWLGESYTIRELLFPLLLSSSNDAGAAILRTLGTTYFSSALSDVYADAGLDNTTIADPTGLTAGNRSTARELARFLVYLKKNDGYVLDITALDSYLGTYRGWINNSPAKPYDAFRGGKHGYTPVAGRTFAGLFEAEGELYAIVLLGSDDLSGDLEKAVALLPQ